MAMPRGPLPNPNRRRTNAPTITTNILPASGRRGPAPRFPKWLSPGAAAKAWWVWAWKTPQAHAWSVGDEPLVARRALLEDYLGDADESTGRLGLLREMRELDDRLGLSPKGLLAMRWQIVDDDKADTAPSDPNAAASAAGAEVSNLDDRRRRLIAGA